jgi:hypothetical protein
VTSIVIPAHNEERVIGRLLDALLADGDGTDDPVAAHRPAGPASDSAHRSATPADGVAITSAGGGARTPGAVGALDIVVVCNGCTDGTAKAAARPGVRVVEIPTPSKHTAMRTGDAHARGFPRLYVDADVVLRAADVRALTGALGGPGGVLAAAPERRLPLAGCAWRVRAYYRVWSRLPAVREGLFGRGVIALTEDGHARVAALPPLMADDLAASLAFAPGERTVVGAARVVVHPPRTWADLIRRRVRAAVSSAQVEQHRAAEDGRGAGPDAGPDVEHGGGAEDRPRAEPGSGRAPGAGERPTARTSTADLRALLRREPRLLPDLAVFLAAAVTARTRAAKAIRTQDFGTWLRDESSRQDQAGAEQLRR